MLRGIRGALALLLALLLTIPAASALGEAASPPALPQIDSSTARKPITKAIYELFTGEYGCVGPEPMASKTHGAWLNLADGKADILFLVAPTKDELAYFAEKGVDIEMKVFGHDGLVFMGNKANPVKNLSSEQVRSIYSGKLKNWNKVKGGKSADIIAYIRNPESGSQRLFENLVWAGYDMPDFYQLGFKEGDVNPDVTKRTKTITESDGMEEITRKVLINQYAIGFNIMSYIDSEFSNSGLKLFSIDGFAPTTENFASGDYPYLTTSYVAIRRDEPADSPARKLYDWMGTQESQDLISSNSTLTVSFSDSVVLPAAPRDPASDEALKAAIVCLNQRALERQELYPFTLEEMEYLKNGVYALSGKKFTEKKFADYFSAMAWYDGADKSDKAAAKKFNEHQKANLKLIEAYEKELQEAYANQ